MLNSLPKLPLWLATAVAAMLFHPLYAGWSAFSHLTTESNTKGAETILDHSTTNNQEQQILLVTPVLGVPNPHSVSVRYDTARDRWFIRNEDGADMPIGAGFNIASINVSSKNAFVHKVTPMNKADNGTMITHPASDYDSEARIMVTRQATENAEPMGPLSVTFNGVYWVIQREDGKPIPLGTNLNVLAVKEGRTDSYGMTPIIVDAELTSVGIVNTSNNATEIQNLDPKAKIFVIRNRSTRPGSNPADIGIIYDGLTWRILNLDLSPLQHGELYNTFIITPSMAATEKVNAGNLDMGWLTIQNTGNFAARYQLDYLLENIPRSQNAVTIQPYKAHTFRLPARAVDLRLTGKITDGRKVVDTPMELFDLTPNTTFRIHGTINNLLWDKVE